MPVVNTLRKAKRSFNIFKKTTLLHKALYFLALLVGISLMYNYGKKQVEGFEEPKTNEFKTIDTVTEIYDNFYATIYDDLVFNKNKNDYEIVNWIKYTKPSAESVVLPVPDKPKNTATSPSSPTLAEQCIEAMPFNGKK